MKKIIFGLLFLSGIVYGFDNPADQLLTEFRAFLTRIPYQSIGKEITTLNAKYDRTLSSGYMQYDERGIRGPSGISITYMVTPNGIIRSIKVPVVALSDNINMVMLGRYLESLPRPYRIQEPAGVFGSRYQYWRQENGIIMIHEETWLSSVIYLHFCREGDIFLGN